MKVYVITEAKPFHEERYIGVKKSLKEAEKALRNIHPYMRPNGSRCYVADATNQLLLFIHEEEIG